MPIRKEGELIAAKIAVYAGDDEEYFSFINSEAYLRLENWMQYRKDSGETIDGNSWVMRQLWNTKEGHYHHGTITDGSKLKSAGIKRLIEDALGTQGIRKKSNLKRNRYEFQADHGFRKCFKTRCEIAGMKSINIEKLMGHSIGISDSYYKITENELLQDYLKAANNFLYNILDVILKEAWNSAEQAKDERAKIQALSLAKECYSMKLELLTHSTVVDDAMRFVSQHQSNTERLSSSNDSNDEELEAETTNRVF